jgi:MSHA biogenesis protein MshN
MSLINQLLKDLEGRHAAGAEIKGIAPQARSLPERDSKPMLPAMLALLGVLVIAAALGAYFWLQRAAPTTGEPLAATPPVAVPDRPPAAPVEDSPAMVGDALLAPVFQLSDELSFAPEPPVARSPEPAPKPERATVKPARREPGAGSRPPPDATPAPDRGAAATPRAAPAEPASAAVAAPPPAAPSPEPVEEVVIAPDLPGPPIDKQTRNLTAYERAENEFRNGAARLRQGRLLDAEAAFRGALREDRSHAAARQALVGLLIDSRRNEDAEQVLREALAINPRQPRHAMLLARLELDRGDAAAAVRTLDAVKSFVGVDAEFYAFQAAALQRAGRHADAAEVYRSALAVSPGNAVWLMGLGISLRAIDQRAEAREAFRRAAESRTLTPELQSYVESQYQDLAARPR